VRSHFSKFNFIPL